MSASGQQSRETQETWAVIIAASEAEGTVCNDHNSCKRQEALTTLRPVPWEPEARTFA